MSSIASIGPNQDDPSYAALLSRQRAATQTGVAYNGSRTGAVTADSAAKAAAGTRNGSETDGSEPAQIVTTPRTLLGETNAKVVVSADGDVLEISQKSLVMAASATPATAGAGAAAIAATPADATSALTVTSGSTATSGSVESFGSTTTSGSAASSGSAPSAPGGAKPTGGAKPSGGAGAVSTEEEDDDTTDLSGYSELQLAQMLADGKISSAQYVNELQRRETAKTDADNESGDAAQAVGPAGEGNTVRNAAESGTNGMESPSDTTGAQAAQMTTLTTRIAGNGASGLYR